MIAIEKIDVVGTSFDPDLGLAETINLSYLLRRNALTTVREL